MVFNIKGMGLLQQELMGFLIKHEVFFSFYLNTDDEKVAGELFVKMGDCFVTLMWGHSMYIVCIILKICILF